MDNMLLDDYRKLVERVMQDSLVGAESVTRVFSNSGIEHAKIVFDAIIDHAQNDISVYARELSTDCWNAQKLRSFFLRSPDTHMNVILDDKNAVSSPTSALSHISEFVRSGRVTIMVLPQKKAGGFPHVTISDGRNVRIERDAQERKAVVAFGHRGMATSVSSLYGALQSMSTPLTVN